MRNTYGIPMDRPMLSRTAEHALRAALYLAPRREAGFTSAAEVAAALGTPPNYTSKTLRRLARKGLLRSERGPYGGFSLDVSPRQLSLLQLLDAVDDVADRPGTCLLGDRLCGSTRPCPAHTTWLELHAGAHALLDGTVLADFLPNEDASDSRCHDNQNDNCPGGIS